MLTESLKEIRDQNEKPFPEDDAKEMEAERGVLGARGQKEGDTKTKHPPKTISPITTANPPIPSRSAAGRP